MPIVSTGKANAFTGAVSIRVPNETSPAFTIINDTWDTDPGDPVFVLYVENDGSAFMEALHGTLQLGGSVRVGTAGGGPKVGFFGTAPQVQPDAPVTLGDVIAALKTLGLVAT